MIETPLLPAPELWATMRAPDPARLLEQLAPLRLENAALQAQNAALQERIRELVASGELAHPIALDDVLRDDLVTAGYDDLSTRPELQAAHQKALEVTTKYGY